MIASLPMYDRPENAAAHDALWSAIRDALGYGPDRLNRTLSPMDSWGHPDLLLGQICNLPYRARFRSHVTRIGAAIYDLPDTPPGYYRSVFITRAEDAARGLAPAALGRFAYNEALSHSGWGAAIAHVTARGLSLPHRVVTGSHRESMLAVAQGRADLAAIDEVTWRMFCRWEPATRDLCVVDRSGLAPGMTFITADPAQAQPLFQAIDTAIANLPARHRDLLGLRGITPLSDHAYDIPLPPTP